MSTEFLAVDGCTVAHSLGSMLSGGSFVITSLSSLKVKAGGSGVYKTPLTVSFTGGNFVGGVAGTAIGSGTIMATATKNLVENLAPLRAGDSGTIVGTYTQTGSPPIPGVPFSAQFEISNSGQTMVKGS